MSEVDDKIVKGLAERQPGIEQLFIQGQGVLFRGPHIRDKWYDNYTECLHANITKKRIQDLKEQGLNVDRRHLMLVADIMCFEGDVKAIGRHGISGRKTSVLARAAFEITAAVLLQAAVEGEEDKLDGIAENIIVGQPVSTGTGNVVLGFKPIKSKGRRKK